LAATGSGTIPQQVVIAFLLLAAGAFLLSFAYPPRRMRRMANRDK
jgi:hypothetical protein